MAKCDLSIELDESRTVFHPGDRVRGAVLVQTDDSMRCDGLEVSLGWETHGRGNRAAGDPVRVELFSGEWTGATTVRYGFELELPAGPATYHGHYLNVGWFLRARADVPWKLDPKAELEISLLPGDETGQEIDWRRQFADPALVPSELRTERLGEELASAASGPEAEASPLQRGGLAGAFDKARSNPVGTVFGCGCLAIILAVLVGGAGLMGRAAWEGIQAVRAGDWAGSVVGLVFGGILLANVSGLIVSLVRWRLLKGRFGTIDLDVQPRVARAGDGLEVRLAFSASKATELQGLTAKLRGYERVVSGSGTNKTTRTHELYDHEVELAPGQQLMANRPVRLQGAVRIPENAGPSFRAPNNQLSWELKLQLRVARFPDWKQDVDVVVAP